MGDDDWRAARVVVTDDRIEVVLPRTETLPSGYALEFRIGLDAAQYRIVPAPGLWCRFLRWTRR